MAELSRLAVLGAGHAGPVIARLAVKAGSMNEDEDQRGLAHMVEHMAFNGSTHFKPGELVSYLESIGARFGSIASSSGGTSGSFRWENLSRSSSAASRSTAISRLPSTMVTVTISTTPYQCSKNCRCPRRSSS